MSFLLELRLVTLKILFWYKPCGIVWTLQELKNSTILPGPSAVLNNDEGGLCLWPPGVYYFPNLFLGSGEDAVPL